MPDERGQLREMLALPWQFQQSVITLLEELQLVDMLNDVLLLDFGDAGVGQEL